MPRRIREADVDYDGNLISRNKVWDTDALAWVAMTQPGGTTGGGVDPVGLKNASAVTINPATEDTLSTLSGKVTACNTGSIAGTVTANAGTNLNTSALALESGGNLATIAGKDFATQTTLSALNDKVTACNTGAIQGTVSVTQNAILRKTVDLASSGAVHTPTSGKKVRVFACQFSLTADMTSVAFRWTSGGSDWHKFLNVKGGGYYGTNTNEKYTEGGTDQALYCNISGTGTVCVNLAYTEV